MHLQSYIDKNNLPLKPITLLMYLQWGGGMCNFGIRMTLISTDLVLPVINQDFP
jgi:hypothetical protein